ncbi:MULTISPECIES: hypothetical protein [Streptomyces]|uniref:Thioredoxin family protein n=1 Tax=Streptomyces lycii TaxID=2654337 RepID=A0ABQ7FJA5_9ACTN|nr:MULTISPECIES: hypothetical protein [Streptomyces]KAF4409017.1 hypothetical protein GCU69_11045 [Streptomyces lycii]
MSTATRPTGLYDVADLETFYGIVQMDRLSLWLADSRSCWSCKRLRERYRRLATVYEGRAEFCRITRESAPAVCDVLNVGEAPATFAFRSGEALDWPWPVGVPAKSEAQHRAWLDRHAA